jgi:hypothetical protein
VSGVNAPGWVTSQAELELGLVEVGRERDLDETVVRLRIPPVMRVLWHHAGHWRLVFKGNGSQFWLDRRRGDGHLLGDSDGGFGTLGDDIKQDSWTISLDRVRRRFRDGRIDEPYEFAHCYLGLQLQYPDDLRKLPRSASLALRFSAAEAALINALPAEQQSRPPSPQMNLHLHTTMPGELNNPAASESSDQTTGLDAILPTAGRPTLKVAILLEMHRRAHRNELADKVAEEARQLRQWLIGNYPNAAPQEAESIENAIREEYWSLKTHPTK